MILSTMNRKHECIKTPNKLEIYATLKKHIRETLIIKEE